MISSLNVYRWVWWWKNVENQSTFDKVMCKSRVSCFLTPGVFLFCGQLLVCLRAYCPAVIICSGFVNCTYFLLASKMNEWLKKCLERRKTLHAGCSKAEPKIFSPPQTLPGGVGWPKLISWRWLLPLPTNPVWRGLTHAISSYRGNRPTNTQTHKHTHRQDRLQYTVPQLASAQCKYVDCSWIKCVRKWIWSHLHQKNSRNMIVGWCQCARIISDDWPVSWNVLGSWLVYLLNL